MIRPIKFRAWERPVENVGFAGKMHYDIDEYFHKWHGHPDYEVMQFTGLHDKNGKEIYEGDVLPWSEESVGVVVYDAPEFKVRVHNFRGLEPFFDPFSRFGVIWEVIGNIYENPELIR